MDPASAASNSADPATSEPCEAPGAAPTSAAARPAAETAGLHVVASLLGGTRFEVEVPADATVAQLKRLLAAAGAPPAPQQRVVLGTQELQDRWLLSERGLTDPAEVSLVNRGPAPDWAQAQGFDGEHPALLREYYDARGVCPPAWLASDEDVWQQLESVRECKMDSREQLRSWSHIIEMRLETGEPASMLRASPGEKLRYKVSGFIHNKNGDGCIHQLVLALDKEIVAELSDGVPGRGRPFEKNVAVTAPSVPGSYMLWSYSDLQYSMRNAKANFAKRRDAIMNDGAYPSCFVGWLVVTETCPYTM